MQHRYSSQTGKYAAAAPSLSATEHRGITLQQMRDLWSAVEAQAAEDGSLPGWVDQRGAPCRVATVTLYDVMKYHVKPRTAEKECSYVELVRLNRSEEGRNEKRREGKRRKKRGGAGGDGGADAALVREPLAPSKQHEKAKNGLVPH